MTLAGAGLTACTGTIKDTQPAPAATPTGGSAGSSGNAGGTANSSGKGGGGSGGSGVGKGGTGGSSGTTGTPVDCSTGTHGSVAPVRRLTAEEYTNAIRDLFSVEAGSKYPGMSGESVTGYSVEPDLTVVGEQGVADIMTAAETIAQALEPNLADMLSCAGDGDEACANTFLDTTGRRAFRRNLTDEERASLIEIYSAEQDDGASFTEAVAVMTAAMLQMPAFLYVVEGDVDTGKDRARTSSELATRLALQLWASIPDDELLDAAENGELETKEQVRAQAERMLEDPRSEQAIRRFFREWSETSEQTVAAKDKAAFDYLDDDLLDAINESFDRFVSDQVSSGTLYSLLRSNKTFVNAKLADFFDVSAPNGDWATVELDADRYTGVLTQPAVLAAHAHTVSPSYVYRGRMIMERLLCQEVGNPPATAMTEFGMIEKPPDPTGKETAAAVEARSSCGGCHKFIDPSGLSLEHFDGLGHWRDEYESGKAIDTTGALVSITDDPLPFTDPVDLMEKLTALPLAQTCFSTQLFRYSAGKMDEGDSDACSIQQISDAMTKDNGSLKSAFIETTQTDGFMYRRGE